MGGFLGNHFGNWARRACLKGGWYCNQKTFGIMPEYRIPQASKKQAMQKRRALIMLLRLKLKHVYMSSVPDSDLSCMHMITRIHSKQQLAAS